MIGAVVGRMYMHVRVFVWGNVLELCCVLVCAVVVVCGSGEVVVRVRVCGTYVLFVVVVVCVCGVHVGGKYVS